MLINCKVCNKEFKCTPSRIRANGNCCSKLCQAIDFKSKNLNAKCFICGKDFHVKPYHLNRYENHCCSQECLSKYRSKIMIGENNHQYGLLGKLNSSFKTGEKITRYGYKKIMCHEHPFKDVDGFVFEHRLVAEKYLLTKDNSVIINGKKFLQQKYIVHHKDGNKLNNDKNNLEVMLKSEHSKLHNKSRIIKRNNLGRFA